MDLKVKNQKLAKDRKVALREQSKLMSSANTGWTLIGLTFKKTTGEDLVNRHINVNSITQSSNDVDVLYCTISIGEFDRFNIVHQV